MVGSKWMLTLSSDKCLLGPRITDKVYSFGNSPSVVLVRPTCVRYYHTVFLASLCLLYHVSEDQWSRRVSRPSVTCNASSRIRRNASTGVLLLWWLCRGIGNNASRADRWCPGGSLSLLGLSASLVASSVCVFDCVGAVPRSSWVLTPPRRHQEAAESLRRSSGALIPFNLVEYLRTNEFITCSPFFLPQFLGSLGSLYASDSSVDRAMLVVTLFAPHVWPTENLR